MMSPGTLLRFLFRPLRQQLLRKPKAPTPLRPPALDVELTNACNAKCIFCPREKTPLQGFMDPATFTRIIARAQELSTRPRLDLCGLGEPLLHPQVVDFARQSAAAGINTGLTTNGSKLTRELSQALLDAGLARMHFSASGIHAQYAQIHGLDFDRTRRNIADFVQLAGPRCRTVITIVANELNRDHISELKAYWQKVGVHRFLLLFVSNRAGALETNSPCSANDRFLRQARKLLARRGIGTLCEVPFCCTFIGWNGNYYTCCQDYTKSYPLGNVFQHSIPQINSLKRDLLAAGWDLCRQCSADFLNMTQEILFKIEAKTAPKWELRNKLVGLEERQRLLRSTAVEYGPAPAWQPGRADRHAA